MSVNSFSVSVLCSSADARRSIPKIRTELGKFFPRESDGGEEDGNGHLDLRWDGFSGMLKLHACGHYLLLRFRIDTDAELPPDFPDRVRTMLGSIFPEPEHVSFDHLVP